MTGRSVRYVQTRPRVNGHSEFSRGLVEFARRLAKSDA